MKKLALCSLAGGMFFFLCSSFSHGTGSVGGENRTGAGGSQADCAGSGCHNSNTTDVDVNIVLKDLFGNEVKDNRYFPGAYYMVRIEGNIYNGTFPKFGFQFAAAQQNGMNAGSYLPTTGLHTAVLGGYTILEQDNPLLTSGTNNSYVVTFTWQAPAAQTMPGPVTLFATVLGANDDQTKSGDKANNYQRTLTPVPLSIASLDAETKTRIFPNPVKNSMNLDINQAAPGNYQFAIFDLRGQVKRLWKEHIPDGELQQTVEVSEWPSGMYQLEIMHNNKRRLLSFYKI